MVGKFCSLKPFEVGTMVSGFVNGIYGRIGRALKMALGLGSSCKGLRLVCGKFQV